MSENGCIIPSCLIDSLAGYIVLVWEPYCFTKWEALLLWLLPSRVDIQNDLILHPSVNIFSHWKSVEHDLFIYLIF